MTDQPNTETDAERASLLELCSTIVEAVRDMDHGAFELTNEEAEGNVFVLLQALLARRAVAPAPAGDVEQRVSDKELDELIQLWDGAPRETLESDLARDLRDARAALSAMPSGRQRQQDATKWVAPISAEHEQRLKQEGWRHVGRGVWEAPVADRWRGLLKAAEMLEASAERQDHGCECLDIHQSPPECSAIANGRDCLCFYAKEALQAEAAAIRTAAAQLGEPDDGWRDIASAPKETRILLYIPAYDTGDPVRLGEGSPGRWRTTSGACSPDAQPSHWRPLPPAPSVPR